jgi:hypothetical protein
MRPIMPFKRRRFGDEVEADNALPGLFGRDDVDGTGERATRELTDEGFHLVGIRTQTPQPTG